MTARALTPLVVAATVLCIAGIASWRSGGLLPTGACGGDIDCPAGHTCQQAVCRAECGSGHWVGEFVELRGESNPRQGIIVACAADGIWVRLDSGIEEHVTRERVRGTQVVQAW